MDTLENKLVLVHVTRVKANYPFKSCVCKIRLLSFKFLVCPQNTFEKKKTKLGKVINVM
jgi:hypothetical protein